MKSFRAALILAALISCAGSAAFSDETPANSAQVVTLQAYPSLRPVHPGTLFTVAVWIRIKEGWHINAHEGLPEFFIPAELSLAENSAVSQASAPRYPLGEKKALGGALQAYPVYEGTQVFYVDVLLGQDVKPGDISIPFSLRVQACDNQVCLAPASVPVQARIS